MTTTQSNDHLIDAAAQMLAALKTALRHSREAMSPDARAAFDEGRGGPEWMFIARDAIAAAERG
ncbi:hypothetical protein PRN20_18090 [Devosia sp. ZB163]|uniref:hypothetical protein n=1 Tax=Devosia sp. ZB163 TaxID=3025938 RepID=UPI0023606ABE|nr:hypothetical protein [Devosia sp. ZB163]MDC9825648.1 hypothetical protein [Devosia sp. ZB163]